MPALAASAGPSRRVHATAAGGHWRTLSGASPSEAIAVIELSLTPRLLGLNHVCLLVGARPPCPPAKSGDAAVKRQTEARHHPQEFIGANTGWGGQRGAGSGPHGGDRPQSRATWPAVCLGAGHQSRPGRWPRGAAVTLP